LAEEIITVKPGDTLGRIAAKQLGDAARWPEISIVKEAPGTPLWDQRDKAPDGSTLIYPGDTLRIPVVPKAPPEIPKPEPDKPKEKKTPEKPWTGYEHQTPIPKLEIFLPKNYGENADITYSADARNGAYSKLLGYSFSESVDDLEGSFSFTVENEEIDADGKTVFDLIPVRSIVKICEGDLERPAFAGILRRRRISASMTSQGARRTVVFSGNSLISCVAEYTVSLDVRIQGVADAMAKTQELKTGLAVDGITIAGFMQQTWDYFQDVSEKLSELQTGISNTAVADTIKNFIGGFDDFVTVSGEEQQIMYNIAAVFFNQANNSIADIWRNILPKPVYEFFAYCGKTDGKPKIMARQVPYGDPDNGNNDWKNLDIYLISPVSLVSYELEQSDEEVYTAFASYIIGSARDRQFYMAVNQTGNDTLAKYNAEKVAVYGFRPLEMSFNGYDRQGNTRNEKIGTLDGAIKNLNDRASYWFSRLDDVYSGSITVCTDFNAPETNPRAGCRAKFLGGEFYINRTDHTWNFGGTPTIKLTVSRGMVYDENGKTRPGSEGVIKNVGRRFRELERESA
jgi:hypothetical protein